MILRAVRILLAVIRHRLDRLLPLEANLPWWVRSVLLPLKLFSPRHESTAISVRLALEELGPIFVKFGQLLSTRRDLFDDDLSDELAKLRDQVPAFASDKAIALIEEALSKPLDDLFATFNPEPLASASVAQIHEATLNSGEKVVVKVIRPGIAKTIELDIRLLLLLTTLVEKYWQDGQRLHPVQIVQDYRSTILNELDLRLEAANANQLKNNFEGSSDLYTPLIYWDYCEENVMVTEQIWGIPVDDIDALKQHGINLKKLAHLGVDIFFTQVFEHNFFHADMHPGNVFVASDRPEHPQYITLDCAIFGSLTDSDKNYLARNLLAFFNRDYHEVARLHIDSGWVAPGTDLQAFESVIRSVLEPVFAKPISEISFGKVLLSLFQTARMFEMEMQPQLVLLQKTLINIEGMGRQIYPELNLWDTAKPFLESWMKQQIGPASILQKITKRSPEIFEKLPDLPDLILDALTEMRNLGNYHRSQHKAIETLKQQIETSRLVNRRSRWMGALLLFMLLVASGTGLTAVQQISPLGWVLISFGAAWLLLRG